MAKVIVTKAKLSKNNVTTNEKIKIQVYAFYAVEEPKNERLPFRLGNSKIKV